MFKVFSVLTAIALSAAVTLALPGFSPEVEARTPAQLAAKGDRLNVRPTGQDCSQRGWPYFETNCLRDQNRPNGQARTVRMIPLDEVIR